ncbi:MAG: molybdopterin biosynthesis protein [Oscillospiraceae bacterium]|nr:molybdopterin biosynthesis protein [Oscillospiraceae bacterium]
MKYEYLTNVPLEKAKTDYLSFLHEAGMKGREETVPVTNALGQITSRAVYAKLCSPHYNASAMDGIALLASKTFGASETTPAVLMKNDFIRVDTGDPLPEGFDAVIMIEDVVETDSGILLYSPAVPWQYIRQIGEDICAGDMLLPSYTQISPAAMGAMLAGGIQEVPVMAKPLIGILPTGDEIVSPSSNPRPGEVMEFNSAIFGGMLTQWGAEPKVYSIIKDNADALRMGLEKAVSECDGLLIGAGTSAGRDDYTPIILKELGKVLYHGLAIKPGKPAVLARVGTKPVLGVPGYPVSGIIVLEEIFKPIIFDLLNKPLEEPLTSPAKLSKRVNSSLKYREFLRVRLNDTADGLTAIPLNSGAGVVTSFVKADAILDIPQNTEGHEAGEIINVRLLKPISQIRNTLSVVGSHDPLIDEAADLLRRENPALSIASSHVGSMGGIFAVKRGEATIAGIHLLDPKTGIYNKSYLKRYFSDGEAVLLRYVGRVQGLIVAAGNPLKIRGFEDVTHLRYVNRQGGSGTRILCDYLIDENDLNISNITGYLREEFTHTAVAAQIAAGTADAGLGIYSAAKLYGLDFIPICTEEYDLLLKAENLELPMVKHFLSVIAGEDFRNRLNSMGGYIIDNPGGLIEF